MRVFLATAGLLLACASAMSQSLPPTRIVVPREIQQISPDSQAPIEYVGDPVQQLQKRVVVLGKHVRVLQSRVTSLEETIRDMRDKTTFTCVAPDRSANGAGQTENCSPMACNYVDGRCRQSAAKTEHCAAGYLWDEGRCVAPPPAAVEEDCGFLGLGCL